MRAVPRISLPPAIVSFCSGGLSIQAASRDRELQPEVVRVVGILPVSDGEGFRIFLPHATSARMRENLLAFPRIAIVLTEPITHRALQVKGDVRAVRDARDDERPLIDAHLARLTHALGLVGIPPWFARGLPRWPAWAVAIDVTDVFEQTPGPGAGEPIRATLAEEEAR